MRLATLAFGAAVALMVGLPTANLILNGFRDIGERLEQAAPDADAVPVWVGSLCRGGGMVVAEDRATVAQADCKSEWRQTLTREQVEHMTR